MHVLINHFSHKFGDKIFFRTPDWQKKNTVNLLNDITYHPRGDFDILSTFFILAKECRQKKFEQYKNK